MELNAFKLKMYLMFDGDRIHVVIYSSAVKITQSGLLKSRKDLEERHVVFICVLLLWLCVAIDVLSMCKYVLLFPYDKILENLRNKDFSHVHAASCHIW